MNIENSTIKHAKAEFGELVLFPGGKVVSSRRKKKNKNRKSKKKGRQKKVKRAIEDRQRQGAIERARTIESAIGGTLIGLAIAAIATIAVGLMAIVVSWVCG